VRRVVVTGLGCLSALGQDVASLWQGLCEGRCGIGPLTRTDPGRVRHPIAGQVWDFDPLHHLEPQLAQRLDRFGQFGLLAGRQAVADAGLRFDPALGLRSAVVLGSGIGGIETLDEGFQRLYIRNINRLYPLSVPKVMLNAAVSALTMEYGIRGPAFAVSSACSSANHALIQALWLVRSGQVDLVLSGGSEACLTHGLIKAWEALRVLAPDTCRPFCAERRGLVLGEGAGVLVLEERGHALARGAHIYAELAGGGMSADAGDLTLPDPDGAARAMRGALQDAGLDPAEVDYVNAHGTGTRANDATESRAIRAVFGAHTDRLAVSSTKSAHGHALGAAGGIEAVATVKALVAGLVPATINFGTPDPECDLDYVPNRPRRRALRAALSNSFAFGGLNAVLAFRHPDACSG
jgi:nodulation protein E